MFRIWSTFLFFACGFCQADNIRVLTELSPPNQTTENGEVTGTATQQVKAILKEAGLTGEFSLYPWARSYDMAKSTPGTLIYSMARTSDRDIHFDWIAPVARFNLAFMALTSRNLSLEGKNALNQYSIAVQREDISYQWLKRMGLKENEHFLVCPDILCSWELLLKGNVDLVIDDPMLAVPTLSQLGHDPELVKVVKPIPSLDVVGYLALSKGGDADLLPRLRNAAIRVEQNR